MIGQSPGLGIICWFVYWISGKHTFRYKSSRLYDLVSTHPHHTPYRMGHSNAAYNRGSSHTPQWRPSWSTGCFHLCMALFKNLIQIAPFVQ